jgi:toxin ParE1/3/4
MRRLEFLEEAEAELIDAVRRYEQERSGLGDDLLAEIRTLAARLLELPHSGRPVFSDVRRARVRRFRYDLVYRVRADALIIVAVMHHRREPGYWKNRL